MPELRIYSRFNAERAALAQVLRSLNEGGIATYDELSIAIGRDVQGEARTVLASAREMLQKEERLVFESVRMVGIKRLRADEVIIAGEGSLGKARKAVARGYDKFCCIDLSHLSSDDQIRTLVGMSVTGALVFGLTKRFFIEEAKKAIINNNSGPLPIRETLKLFGQIEDKGETT